MPEIREISCRTIEVFFRALRAEKKPLELLAEGSGYTVAQLQDKSLRIEWTAFARVNANAGRIWTPEQLEAIGGAFLKTPLVRSIVLPARLLFTPRRLFQWVLGDQGGLGKTLIPCVTNSYRELGPERAEFVLTLNEGYAPSPELFIVTRGSIAGMPCALGLEPARVTMLEIPRGARYEIAYPPLRGLLYAIRSAVTWPFTARAAATELRDAHQELKSRYLELEDYRLNLEEKVVERTEELNRTVNELKEAQQARDKLFANINHEIRTPLSIIRLAVSDVRRRRSDLDPKTYEQLDGVEASTRQLLRLVDGLLVLAAGQEQRLKLRVTPFDVAALAKLTVSQWSNAAAARGLALAYDGPEALTVQADEEAVDRILANLVSNALKFTPSGGSVSVEIRSAGDRMELAVRDTGVGIDDEFKKRIFGRFEQGRAAVHSDIQGSGVGLSIVRELARAHGGDVGFESGPSGGSHFVVTLPASPSPASLPPIVEATDAPTALQVPEDFGLGDVGQRRPEVLEAPGKAQATILIAEDNPQLRAFVAELLRADYRVLVAPDGISALNLARRYLPDMLVTDIGMPGMDGIELTRRFRELNGNRLSPVLLLTAMGTVRRRLEGFEAGAVDYIIKPFEPEELRARIRNQLLLRSLALQLHDSEKSLAIGVLSTGLAHELRNPANGIVNALPALRRLLPPEAIRDDLPAGQLFKVVEQCTEQLSVLSRQLLGLRADGELEMFDVRVADLFGRAESLASAALRDRRFEREISSSVDSIRCSPSTLLQALGNLLENAAHATGPNGWIRLSCSQDGERAVLEVADNGPGIPVELHQKIFEPFFSTKAPGVGTGLGLSTAREIVLRHSGTIEVRNGSPGAVFRIELPNRVEEGRQKARA